MLRLTEQDFPLRAMGNLIYGRTQSSPICTTMTTETAEQIANGMNHLHEIHQKARHEGPVLVTTPDMAGVNW